MNIVIIEGNQTLPHTISLLKAITAFLLPSIIRSAPDGKPISIIRPFHEEKEEKPVTVRPP